MYFGDAEKCASDGLMAVRIKALGVKGQFGRARWTLLLLGAASLTLLNVKNVSGGPQIIMFPSVFVLALWAEENHNSCYDSNETEIQVQNLNAIFFFS